jgi:hypothetical protein
MRERAMSQAALFLGGFSVGVILATGLILRWPRVVWLKRHDDRT